MAHVRSHLLCALALAFGTACELVVPEGQTTVLADGSSVLGVAVHGGTLIVEDADVSGPGVVVERGDSVPATFGPAIVADGGVVRIRGGRIVGGNLLVIPQDPNTPAIPPQPDLPFERPLPSALVAAGSVVEIDGGILISGGQTSLATGIFFTTPAVVVTGGALTIRGGDFVLGNELSGFRRQSVVRAQQSRVAIGGGRFGGWIRLAGSRSLITRGWLRMLALGPSDPVAVGRGCTQLQGGILHTTSIESADETLLILGTGFNHPLGQVPITSVSTPGSTPSAQVTGILADGTPLVLNVFAAKLPAHVVLAPPGSVSCAAL